MTTEREVRVRRGPRVWVFVGLGAVLGFLVALVLTVAFPRVSQYSTAQVLGFLAVIGVAAGVVLGGLVAIVLDASSKRRARTVLAQRDRIRSAPEDAADR